MTIWGSFSCHMVVALFGRLRRQQCGTSAQGYAPATGRLPKNTHATCPLFCYFVVIYSRSVRVDINNLSTTFDPAPLIPPSTIHSVCLYRNPCPLSARQAYLHEHSITETKGMRAIAISLLVAAPAFVSAATAPLRKRISGSATFYYTQTGNAYVIAVVWQYEMLRCTLQRFLWLFSKR